MPQEMSLEMLKELYESHIAYVKKIDDICKKYQFPQSQVRKPNMPEYLTENMIRLIIINYLGDKTCRKGEVGIYIQILKAFKNVKHFLVMVLFHLVQLRNGMLFIFLMLEIG